MKTADEDELSVQPSLLLTSTHSTNLLSSTNSVSYSILCSRTNLYSTYTHTTHSFPQKKGLCHAVTQAFAYFMNICLFLQSYKRLFYAVSTYWLLDLTPCTHSRFYTLAFGSQITYANSLLFASGQQAFVLHFISMPLF